ncbi:MAG: hypothetical protein ACPGHU_02060, partial [Porticoccaceae bacterium]
FSSFLMYIVENDIPVTVNDVVVNGDTTPCADAAEPADPTITPLNITRTSSAAGYEFVGIDCVLTTVDGETDSCIQGAPEASKQAIYVIDTTSVVSAEDPTIAEKTVRLGYASGSENTTGVGFRLHFDSSVLTVKEVSNVLAGAIASGAEKDDSGNDDDDSSTDKVLTFGWATIFGPTFPGSQTAELATVTFTHAITQAAEE